MMKKAKTIVFLEMLEESLMKRIQESKNLGKKDKYSLNRWEELFAHVHERKKLEEDEKLSGRAIQRALEDVTGIDIKNLIITGSGIEDDKAMEFQAIFGHKLTIAALIGSNMKNDPDWEQIILTGMTGFASAKSKKN